METVETRDDLFARMSAHTPDLVLLDNDVVQRDAGILGLIRSDEKWHDVRVIVTAPFAALEDSGTGLPWGVDDCVSKPFRVPELLGRVRTQLRASTQLRAARVGAAGHGRRAPARARRRGEQPAADRHSARDHRRAVGDRDLSHSRAAARALAGDLAFVGDSRASGRLDGHGRRRARGPRCAQHRRPSRSLSGDRDGARDESPGVGGGYGDRPALRADARAVGDARADASTSAQLRRSRSRSTGRAPGCSSFAPITRSGR